MEEWDIEMTPTFKARIKGLEKNNRLSVESALENLSTYMNQLYHGINPMQIRFGFVHPEGNHGAVAIAGSRRRGARAVRLYVYPDLETRTLHLVTAGDKGSQQRRDIPFVRDYVKDLRTTSEEQQTK
jgi:hypothetical protein